GGRVAGNEGHRRRNTADGTDGGGNADDAAARLVDWLDRSRFRRLAPGDSRARCGGQFVRIAHGFASLKFKPVAGKTLDFNILQPPPRSPRATGAAPRWMRGPVDASVTRRPDHARATGAGFFRDQRCKNKAPGGSTK